MQFSYLYSDELFPCFKNKCFQKIIYFEVKNAINSMDYAEFADL